MADEKSQSSSSDKSRGDKRRYFRRRRKGKKVDGRPEQSPEATAAKLGEESRSVAGAAERQEPSRKKRRPRNRRTSRRQRSQVVVPQEQEQEPEPEYQEPTSVYVYTYVVRPAYRDMISDYRPEPLFQPQDDHEPITSMAMERLQAEINAQLDEHFNRAQEAARPALHLSDALGVDDNGEEFYAEDLYDEDLYDEDLSDEDSAR
jgi:hypothetical protein